MAHHRARILLVEDDPVLAGAMADLLQRAHYEVDGPHATVSDAMAAIARNFPDGAVLDLHGGAEGVDLVKDDLEVYDIPFLDCSDQDERRIPAGPKDLQRRILPWLSHIRH